MITLSCACPRCGFRTLRASPSRTCRAHKEREFDAEARNRSNSSKEPMGPSLQMDLSGSELRNVSYKPELVLSFEATVSSGEQASWPQQQLPDEVLRKAGTQLQGASEFLEVRQELLKHHREAS